MHLLSLEVIALRIAQRGVVGFTGSDGNVLTENSFRLATLFQ